MRHVEAGTLERVKWHLYAKRNLARMLRFLECEGECCVSNADALKAIMQALRKQLLTRPRPQGEPKGLKLFIRLEWTTHQLQRVGVRDILLDPAIIALLPDPVQCHFLPDAFMVVKKLSKSIRGLILNHNSVVKKIDKYPAPAGSCMCRKLYPARFRPNNGCVLTGQLNLVKHDRLRRVLECGPNFRDINTKARAIESVRSGLMELAAYLAGKDMCISSFNAWMDEVLQRISKHLESLQPKRLSTKQKPLLDFATRKALRKLQRHLVIVPIDKASNNIGFVCKSLYAFTLRQELDNSGAYEKVDISIEDLVAAHEKFLKPKKIQGEHKLPFLYWLPKFHKDPVGARFIAASNKCTTSKLSKVLSSALNLVLHTLRDKDNERIQISGVRRFFVVETYEELSGFLSEWRRGQDGRERSGLYTGDFSTMYTSIPHEELFDAVERAIREAFDIEAGERDCDASDLAISWSAKGSSCVWVRATKSLHKDNVHAMPLAELNALVRYLVSNTYLSIADSIYRQTVGIPMGTNCAPVLANLFLYSYESRYVSRIEREQGLDAARNFHMTFRLIDDVLSVDNPLIESAVSVPFEEGGMYPTSLDLNKTSKSPDAVEFIGVNVEARSKRFRLSVYDKRKSFPFHVRRYPLMSSLIPRSIPYGVFVGLLHRGYRICSGVKDFLSYALDVGCVLRDNGCSTKRLKVLFKSFVIHDMHKYPRSRSTEVIRQFCQKLGNKST